MGILKEVTDDIKIVSDSIKNIKSIYEAIKDGKKYIETQHPEIKSDVAAMCEEMKKTCAAIATASRVITNFRFNSSDMDKDPTRFNEWFIKYKTNKNEAGNLIRSLKGHCQKIKYHADKISQGNQDSFWKYLGFNTEEKNKELGELLQGIYNDERDLYNTVYKMAESMNAAIEDVTEALCLNGMMHSSKVPEAALKLNEYRTIFKELETSAAKTEDNLNEIVQELN